MRVSGSQAAETLDHVLSLAARNFDESPAAATAGAGAGRASGADRRRPRAWVSDRPARRDWAPSLFPTPPPRSRRSSGAGSARRSPRSGARSASCGPAPPARSARPRRRSSTPTNCCSTTPRCSTDVRDRIDGGAVRGVGVVGRRAASSPPSSRRCRIRICRPRADDVRAVGDQVLRAMLGVGESAPGPTGVLVAADLTPAEAAELDPARVAAVLLAFGSPHAHNVILLRAKGIPVIVGAGPTVLSIPDGATVAVDGGRGEFVVDPPTMSSVRSSQARVAALAQRQHAGAGARRASPRSPATVSRLPSAPTSARSTTHGRPRPTAPTSPAWCAPSSCSSAARTHRTSRSSSRSTARSPNRSTGGESRCAPWMSAVTSRWSSCRHRPS